VIISSAYPALEQEPNNHALTISLHRIKEIIESVELIPLIESGFIAHSEGAVATPPVGELVFDNPLGDIISGKSQRRVDDKQITVADLTGLAVQDIQIAKAVSGV